LLDRIVTEDLHSMCDDVAKTRFEDMRILITGGAGFLGSWLADVLIRLDAEVTSLDNLSTGVLTNIDHLTESSRFRLIQSDVESYRPDSEKYDLILHLASRPSPEDYQTYPVETMTANSIGTLNMLELSRRHDSVLLYTSTSEVYGDPEIIPTPETYWGMVNPVGTRSPYDESKRFGEALCKAYEAQHGLDVRIARIFNTYGPRLRAEGQYGRVISRFILQALKAEPITVYGDGSQTRSFAYVTDVIRGLLLMLTSKCRGEIINLGNQHETPILELAEKIRKMVQESPRIAFHPIRPDDPKRRCPDVSKAKTILGWEPKVALDDGLKRTMSWFTDRVQP